MASEFLVRNSARARLSGYVRRRTMQRMGKTIRRWLLQKPGTLFTLDCSRVEDFCGFALAEIVLLRRELQWQGSDVILANCSDHVRSRLAVPLFESLAAGASGFEISSHEAILPE